MKGMRMGRVMNNNNSGNELRAMQSSFISSASAKKMKTGYQSTYSLNKGEQKDILDRYKSIVEKLKAKLEGEKKKLNQVRMLYAKEIQSKTELGELLFQCTEEVRAEIMNERNTEKGFHPARIISS